jgi:hypothetical protein
MKLPNKEAKASAEAAEGRARTKENDVHHHTYPTQSGIRVSQGSGGVRRTAQAKKQERFTALLHHLTIGLLRESYYALKRSAAPVVDGVSWQEYEHDLEERLISLHQQVHRGVYRAQPSRRVYIPKADGRQRPALPRPALHSVGRHAWTPQPAQSPELETHPPNLRTMDPSSACPASLP